MRIIPLMILLALALSCQDEETSFIGEQCSPQFAPQIQDPIDLKWYIPAEESICRCRQYQINKDRIGPMVNQDGSVTVIRRPIEYCNLIKGYHPKTDSRLFSVLDWWRLKIIENIPEKQVMDDKLSVGEPRIR